MDTDQSNLYKKWTELENKILGPFIDFRDLKKIKPIRELVWDKLKKFLSIDENFDLGQKLNKTAKEMFQQEWPPPDWSQNKKLAMGAIFRANSGLQFLNRCLECIHKGGTDIAFSRSLYILLSHNTELILNALFFLINTNLNKKELIEKTKTGHNLKVLSDKLKEKDLNIIGIKKVEVRNNGDLNEYVITMINNDSIVVQDLIETRYDFKYDQLRDLDPNESERMKKETEILLDMTNKIIKMLE
ncbi:MAG: hypothetical protein Q7K16_02975 [Candidatus Azambacteria bacterium]|nr:hypothetical protein [Candidatus Azambacteria bacterium]